MLYRKFPHPPSASTDASAVFHETDLRDWAQLSTMFETTVNTFGRVDILVNGAGIFEPPSSSFSQPPGSSLVRDAKDANPGQYDVFAVNTIAPIRLAQIAIDYWLQHKEAQGNLLWVASMGGYVHSMMSPLYFSSKAAILSMVKSLGRIKASFGIRNSAVCPSPVWTPIFEPDYARGRLREEDVSLTADECANTIMSVLQEPQYGDGSISEVQKIGTKDTPEVHVRDVPLEALYPTVGVFDQVKAAMAEEE
jgi:NAD(P)-dependent dehydrogenase (short-subunit alcohol dehydrogenase family)